MKVITKLFIPSSMDDTLRAKILEVEYYPSNSTDIQGYKVALQNCITYTKIQMQQAFTLGIEQGKLEALRALREELDNEQ